MENVPTKTSDLSSSSSSISSDSSVTSTLNESTNESVIVQSHENLVEPPLIENDKKLRISSFHPRPGYRQDLKHKAITEKAKMNFKPHIGNAASIYLQMIREENEFKNEPAWDSSQQCLLKDLIEAMRENESAKEQLKRKRIEHKLARIERDKQIQDIQKEEENFSASFLYYDKFVKENIEKRERFLEKTQTEIKTQEELVQQIVQADTSIELLNEIKHDMLKCIESRKDYVDYLESVRAAAPDEFPNGVHDIIERYELLVMIREELASEQTNAIEEIQVLSKKMFKITNERIEEMMKLRNKVTELYRCYDTAKRDALYWETIVNKVEDMTEKQTEELSGVKTAVWSLYLQICEKRKLPIVAKSDICKQLSVIEDTIDHLRKALLIAKRKQAKTLKENKSRIKSTEIN